MTDGESRGGGDRSRRRSSDFQASVNRLERAVDELVSSASSRVSDRATAFIDETSDRLERETGGRRERGSAGRREQERAREFRDDPELVTRKLYRDPTHQKLGGVCAGIARYYGVERWVVRCIAITGVLFFPTIVLPAYVIALFVMDKPPRGDEAPDPQQSKRHGRHDHRSPAPELGPRLSPRYSLRNVKADLSEVELRLRRMESHVTSGRYELQRELNRIEGVGQ